MRGSEPGPGLRTALSDEPGKPIRVRHKGVRQDLQRDLMAQLRVSATVDDAYARLDAIAEKLQRDGAPPSPWDRLLVAAAEYRHVLRGSPLERVAAWAGTANTTGHQNPGRLPRPVEGR